MEEYKICVVCEKSFTALRKDSKACSKECYKIIKNKKERLNYGENLIPHICIYCSKEFLGKRQEQRCLDCKRIKKVVFKQTREVEHRCRQCNVLLKTETKNISRPYTTNIQYSKTCDNCLKQLRVDRSKAQQGENNTNYKNSTHSKFTVKTDFDTYNNIIKIITPNEKFIYTPTNKIFKKDFHDDCIDGRCDEFFRRKNFSKKPKTKKFHTKEEFGEFFRQRMILDNPMKRPEVVEQMTATLLEKIERGDITYKTGKDHHLWKGNRPYDKVIRTRLVEWRKKYLKNAEYRCQLCGHNDDKLEVHHVEPFRDILTKFLKKPISEYDINSEEFEKLIQDIVLYHDVVEGMVVCKHCHATIDECRKIKYED